MAFVALGIAASGAGVYALRYVNKQRKLAAEATRIRDAEELGTERAIKTLNSYSYFADLANLRKEIEGEIILPTDGEKYQACRRRAFNQSQRGFPAVIARPANTSDVVACIKFINKHRKDINLCIASGCHSAKCMMDNSFVLDLFKMNKVELDRENMIVKVEGGSYLEEIDKVLEPYNLGVPVGTYPQTGVGGLVLGGGYGFLSRMLGFSVDNFLEAEVVLPIGEVVIANDDKNADLMWGLRGGAGNFGVVTKFVFKVHHLPTHCMCGVKVVLTPTLSSAVSVALNYDKLVNELPDNVAAMMALAGGAPVTPTVWAYFGEESDPKKVPSLQQASNLGGWVTVQNTVKKNSYHKDLQRITTPLITSGFLYHSLIQFGEIGKPLPQEFWENLLKFTTAKLSPYLRDSTLVVTAMGGRMTKMDPTGKTCVSTSVRNARYFGIMEIYWKPEFGDQGKQAAREWAHAVTALIKPYSNETLRYAAADNSVVTADILEKDQIGYGSDRYPKLRAIKKKYDPTNLFKNNANIAPAE